ncbi:prepilin-type N-terminal cleavage/methylation domain-containing protein [Acidiferrobacter sp. SPIII_3]|jgi:prepilin-type N-terminal cleavage/methylation domain-containing protein|uniref:prepilin-type N-terminal cleavage/methylation domain-containing protein n=1 Tax=Acidiferrobacter sp. SPIII_3 TaxID=1281578 RepID=UPI00143D1A55|nr:prepilin-type N-terminal cleavage/methylation domain-containing protein [Acidiferrobacter sp. SPIII_3]
MRSAQPGFTLMELIVAIALTAALIAGLAAFLHDIVLTERHAAPRARQVRQFLLVNGALRHELAATRPGDIALSAHRLLFLSGAAYRALPPARYFYSYIFHPARHTLSLTLRGVRRDDKPGETLFRGVLLRNVAVAQFAGLLQPARTQDPSFWVRHIPRRTLARPSVAPRVVVIRLDIRGGRHSTYRHLPPLLYALAWP